jgi:hypothetical protein
LKTKHDRLEQQIKELAALALAFPTTAGRGVHGGDFYRVLDHRKGRFMLVTILVVLLILFLLGGGYGYRSGNNALAGGGGLLGLILLIIIILFLLGHISI